MGGVGEASLGGAALLAATLSRYEARPMAFVAGAFGLARARRERTRLVAAALALTGPLLWLAWNRYAHGETLWALRRVAAFRAHAGGGPGLLEGYPLAAVRDGLVLLGSAFVAARARRSAIAPRAAPLMYAAAASFVFLLVGDLLGGAPTHHPERALLPAFAAFTIGTVPAASLARRAREGLAVRHT